MTKFKTQIIILAILLVSGPVHSWEPSYWFGGGGIVTNYRGDFFNRTASEPQWPINLGITANVGITLGLTESLGIHTQTGLSHNRVNIFNISDSTNKRKRGTQLAMTSVDLSPMLRLYLTGVSPNLYIGLGFNVSYLIKCSKEGFDKGTTTDESGVQTLSNENFVSTNCLDPNIQTNQVTLDVPWLLKRFNFGLTAGVGMGYRSSDNIYLSFDCTYTYGLSPSIISGAQFGNLKTQNILLTVNVGIPI